MSPSLKGITMKEGQVGVLTLDGTLLFVEAVTPICAIVVALPEQPTTRTITPSFTPGRVGGKRISAYAQLDPVIEFDQLSPRNQTFVKMFQRWREEKGINYVDRTPEEVAAAEAAAKAPTKEEVKALKAQQKAEAKAAKKALKVIPRYLQRCTTCGQQPGHPDHGTGDGKHEFAAPAQPLVAPIPDGQPLAPPVKIKKASIRPQKDTVGEGAYRWNGTTEQLELLAAANPKYGEGNSGRMICDLFGEAGDAGLTMAQVLEKLAVHPKPIMQKMNAERAEVAVRQLVIGKLIVPVA